MCDTEGIVNGYKGVVVPDDEREPGAMLTVVAVVSLCGPPSLCRVRSHVNWVLAEGIREAWFLLQL